MLTSSFSSCNATPDTPHLNLCCNVTQDAHYKASVNAQQYGEISTPDMASAWSFLEAMTPPCLQASKRGRKRKQAPSQPTDNDDRVRQKHTIDLHNTVLDQDAELQ